MSQPPGNPSSSDPRRKPKSSKPDARALALDVLQAVFAGQPTPAERAFEQHPQLAMLAERDRAFARLLYATTLRRLGTIDRALKPHLKQWPKDMGLLNCLRLGATQLQFLGTPPHAAIGETVQLAKRVAPFGAKMVNAVLRRVSEAPVPTPNPLADLPAWLAESWRQAYGDAKAASIAAALDQAPLDLTVPIERTDWAATLDAVELGSASIRLKSHNAINELIGYEEGRWWVQDIAAAAIVPLMGDLKGKRVLDLCAAPGGKTAQLIAAGAEVTAVESIPERADRLKVNLARLKMSCQIKIKDARNIDPAVFYDAILLDAPCTATGTLRRHPDIAHARRPADVTRMASLQTELLTAAAPQLNPGGQLIYAVCSLQLAERKNIFNSFLTHDTRFLRQPFEKHDLYELPIELDEDGDFQTFPDDASDLGGMDGFYAARLIRTE